MMAIYESTIALKDGALGGKRKKAIAEVFLHEKWKKDKFELSDIALKYYSLIIEENNRVKTG